VPAKPPTHRDAPTHMQHRRETNARPECNDGWRANEKKQTDVWVTIALQTVGFNSSDLSVDGGGGGENKRGKAEDEEM